MHGGRLTLSAGHIGERQNGHDPRGPPLQGTAVPTTKAGATTDLLSQGMAQAQPGSPGQPPLVGLRLPLLAHLDLAHSLVRHT